MTTQNGQKKQKRIQKKLNSLAFSILDNKKRSSAFVIELWFVIIIVSIMVENRGDMGFTITELLVTLVIMSIFLVFFIQAYMTAQAQQVDVKQRAAANSIAQSNLQKISSRTLIPATTTACDSSSSSPNNPIANSSLNSETAGSIIATTETSDATAPKWTGSGSPDSGLAKETVNLSALPPNVVQKMIVQYPRGCESTMPAKIISTVAYGTESISHVAFVK